MIYLITTWLLLSAIFWYLFFIICNQRYYKNSIIIKLNKVADKHRIHVIVSLFTIGLPIFILLSPFFFYYYTEDIKEKRKEKERLRRLNMTYAELVREERFNKLKRILK